MQGHVWELGYVQLAQALSTIQIKAGTACISYENHEVKSNANERFR